MTQKNISGREISNYITSDDILGKEVIDTTGATIGISEKVLIEKDSLEILGISIDKGFLKRNLVIGRDYIDRITEHALFLNIRVAYEIRGMFVFDTNGKKIGIVEDVGLFGNKNKIEFLNVKSGVFKKIKIPVNFIEKIGYNVILNLGITELRDYLKSANKN